MAPILIRPARPADADGIAEVHLAARWAALPYLPELHTDDETRAWFAGGVLPTQTVRVAEFAERVVGFVALHGGSLEHLYVLPGEQGRGTGSRLLEQAKALSPNGLSLWTFQRNTRARTFYQHRGFIAVDFGDGSGNEEGEPDVRYRWNPVSPGHG